ncbi:GGDEF domain-containing protein [Sphingomonas sp. RT2P30]|uniref:GGDEF domain-containing protein n=1 Tax=Parasphingomonas halimpatiens TaxID=3096162 RepID=UPI002FC9764C
MAGATVSHGAKQEHAATRLYDAIGAFLQQHRLSPDPRHYDFAYRVLSDPRGVVAQSVAAMTEGGIRLSSRDIESLGGKVAGNGSGPTPSAADGLVAQTQMQVDDFSDMVRTIRAETQGFGRDLAASADALRNSDAALGVTEVVRLTGAMLDRVRLAENRLEAATHEANELRAKLEEARDNARRDPLTDLPNRRAFEEAFAAGVAAGDTLCVAVCDIDHFKLVNDRFGHSVGDRVLKAIATALLDGCPGHFVARYGGEEFAVLFSGVSRSEALAILEKARVTVANKRYRLRESDEPLGAVTFSAGLTTAQPGENLGTVFGRADALLYAAKDGGRNLLRAA